MKESPSFLSDLLTREMESSGLTEEQLAGKLEISRAYLNHIKNGRRAITQTLALRLKDVFDIDTSVWLGSNAVNPDALPPEFLVQKWKSKNVQTLVNHHINEAVNSNLLGIRHWDRFRLDSCSYKFQNGKILPDGGDLIDLQETTESVELKSGSSATLHTLERLTMHPSVLGHLSGTSMSVSLGLSVDIGGFVHGDWDDTIQFRVLNTSNDTVEIDKEVELVRVSFEFLKERPLDAEKFKANQKLDGKLDLLELFGDLNHKIKGLPDQERNEIIRQLANVLNKV